MSDIFIKIIEMSISASWLIAVVIILRLLFKKVPRRGVCCLWALVALMLVCPFSIESRLSLIPDVKLPIVTNIENADAVGAGDTTGVLLTGSNVNWADGVAEGTADSRTDDLPSTDEASRKAVDVLNIASIVWLAGICVLLIYALATYMRIKRRTLASVKLEGNIYLCDDIGTPFILGVLRTKIFIPSKLSEEEREYVLAHENAHLKRLDNLWKPLGYVILAVYWFNPLVWFFYMLLCRDIEIACDERVIEDKDIEYKKLYATTLLNCSADKNYITACPLAFGEVGVKQRIKAVLNYKKPAFWVVVVAVLVCIAAAVGFMTNPSSKNDAAGNVTESTPESETSGESDSAAADAQTETQTRTEQETGSAGADEVRELVSDIYVEPGNASGTLSYLEQYERSANKEGFLSSCTDSGDFVFDLYADELRVKRPEKYEQLKSSADAVCMLYDIDEKSREVFHDDVGRDTVVIHTASGEDFIVKMRLRGELWWPWMTLDSKDFNYEYYREREAQLKAVSAEELRALDDEINPLESIILGTGDGWIALAKLDGEDTVLYGDHSGSSVALRHEDKVIPVSLSYLSTRISVPLFYSGDFDNDGKTEYSIWVCVLTGTGISCDQLYMLETDWNEAEDGSIEYSISEYQAYYQNREVMKIDCQYDKESKLLSVAYNGEKIDTADLTRLFEQYPGEYVGVYFGDYVSFTYSGGQWYYETVGGITRKNSGMVNYQYSVHMRGRVVYDGHNFGLEDVEVWTENHLDEIN